MDRLNNAGSCITIPNILDNLFLDILFNSCPSRVIDPFSGLYSLKSKLVKVDFPDPDYPTIATFSLLLISRLKLLNIGSGLDLYLKFMF